MQEGGRLAIGTENVELIAPRQFLPDPEAAPGPVRTRYRQRTPAWEWTRRLREDVRAPLHDEAEGEGDGLGLTTVYAILKEYGGGIWVYSRPGTGRRPGLPPARRSGRLAAPRCRRSEIVGGTEHVLVVDDESSFARSPVRCLEEFGYRTTSFSDRSSLREAFREVRRPSTSC